MSGIREPVTRGRIKTGKASLIGGIAVGITVYVLWIAIAREIGAASLPVLFGGLVVASVTGAWIRIADL